MGRWAVIKLVDGRQVDIFIAVRLTLPPSAPMAELTRMTILDGLRGMGTFKTPQFS